MEPERTTAQVETALAKQIEKLLSGEVVEEHSEKVVKIGGREGVITLGFTIKNRKVEVEMGVLKQVQV